MLGTLKLANKLRNRQRGGEKNSHADPVTLIQCLDMPRPPGRRRLEQPRPPERDSESGDPARPRIRDWFGNDRETRQRKKNESRYRDNGHRRHEERNHHDGRNKAKLYLEDEDYMHVNEEVHLGKRQRQKDKRSHQNEGFQDKYHRHDKERRKEKKRYKDEDLPLSDEDDYHLRYVENSLHRRNVLNKKKTHCKYFRSNDSSEERQRYPQNERPQKRKETKPQNLKTKHVKKRSTMDDRIFQKQPVIVKSKRRPSLTIKRGGMQKAQKQRRSKPCDNKQEVSSPKRKGWVEGLRVYKEPTNKRLTVFKGILGKDRQFAKSKEVSKPKFCQTGFRRAVPKPDDWQAGSTRFEVNTRLGNIERSLKDLALSTKNVVHTRLRVIENSLKDITGFRDKLSKDRNKPAQTTRHGRTTNRVAPKQKQMQTLQWVYESKAYHRNERKTNKEKPKYIERERKVARKDKKTYDREERVRKVKEKSPERTKKVRKEKEICPDRVKKVRKEKDISPERVKKVRKEKDISPERVKVRKEKEISPEIEKKRVRRERKRKESIREPEPEPRSETPPEIPDEEIETETAYPEKITCDVHIPSGQGDRRNLKDMHFCIFDDTVIDVDGAPKQTSIVDTTIEGDLCPPDLRGIVVLDIDDTIAIVVTDWANRSIKCFYSIENQNCYSQLKLASGPWGIKKLKNNLIGVTIPKAQQVMLLKVTPDLIHESTIETSKSYWGLAVMTSSTLIGGSSQPSCLDEIDVEGNILQSFSNITSPDGTIENPDCIHVTKTGDILLSDSGRKSVMCVTSSGDVKFTFSPRMGQELLYPSGVVSISSGDILLADSAANKVIHLNETGKYERDVLASRSDVEKPFGLCVSGDKIYVATRCREVQVYSFS